MRTVLVLGGTGEARSLAAALVGSGAAGGLPPVPAPGDAGRAGSSTAIGPEVAGEAGGADGRESSPALGSEVASAFRAGDAGRTGLPPALGPEVAGEVASAFGASGAGDWGLPPAPGSSVLRGYDRAGVGAAGVRVVSSLAGRVSAPRLPVGEVRIGGFGGVDGLVAYLRDEGVSAVVDATHPFAERITANAAEATRLAGVPFLLLRRPGWVPEAGDDWQWVGSVAEAADAVGARRAFITTGRQGLAAFRSGLARTVDPPEPPVPGVEVLLDRGPYTVEGELDLLRRHRIEVVVTKDSGGPMTAAKLVAARRLGLPVVVVRRPPVPEGVALVSTVAEAVEWVSRGSGAG